MAITHAHNDITDYAGHRQNVKVYADLDSMQVIFEGLQVNIDPMPLSSLIATEAVSGPNNPRVKVARADITTTNGDEWVLFKRRPAWRFYTKEGVRVTSGTDGPTQITQILTYLNDEFNKSLPSEVSAAAFIEYDIHADVSYTGGDSDGTAMKPFTSIQSAVDAAEDGDQIFLKGDFAITSVVNLPADKSLHFFGTDITQWCYPTFDAANGMLAYQSSSSCTKKYSFDNIRFINSGSYGLYIRSALEVSITNCEFKRCGWNGTGLSTTAADDGTTLGYDSVQADLQAFWASNNTSNGGAMRIRSTPVVAITDCELHTNLRGMRIQDCGIGGAGVIARNRTYNNIESGIYLAAGSYGYTAASGDGCENFTVYNNFSANNSNNGILVIGGSNNIVSLNRVEGNWNAGVMLWNVSDTRARDMDLDNNNRSNYNGIGNSGDAAASVQISGPYMRSDATFLAEILDTTIHNSGMGSSATKNGIMISDGIEPVEGESGLPTGRPLIAIDDCAFVDQDYGIVVAEDADNLRLSISDCRYTQTAIANVSCDTGSFTELPFSNVHLDAAALDFCIDASKSRISVKENSKVIQTYGINELQAVGFGTYVRILAKDSNRIQWDSLNVATTKVNGILVNGVLATAVNELNALFTQTASFLSSAGNPVVSGVVTGNDLTLTLADSTGVTIDVTTLNVSTDTSVASGALSGTNLVLTMTDGSTVTVDIQTLIIGANPTYPGANWYSAFGTGAGTLLPSNRLTNGNKNNGPWYFGETLEKGKEWVWTYDAIGTMHIGIWDGATAPGSNAGDDSNWSLKYAFEGNAASGGTQVVRTSTLNSLGYNTVGTDIDSRVSTSGYSLSIGDQLAIRYMQNDKLGLFEITDGRNTLIAESNDTYTGPVTLHADGQHVAASTILPYFVKREDVFEFAHRGTVNSDGTGGLDADWRDGTEQRTILKTISTFGPGQKMRWNLDFSGTNQRWGLGYTGAATGESDPTQYLTDDFRYGATEQFYQMSDWILNTNATHYDAALSGYGVASAGNTDVMGEVEIRYVDANTITLYSVKYGEKIATLDRDPLGLDQRIYFGRVQYDTALSHLPIITRMDISPATSTSDHRPDLSDQDLTTTEGASVNYFVQKDTPSDAVTMYAAEGLPSWLILNQTTGQILGTAPSWTGTPGSGLTNDTVVTIKAANPFGIENITLTVKVGEDGQSTNWTKAYEFDGTIDNLRQSGSSSQTNPLRKAMNRACQPWTVAMVLKPEHQPNAGTFFCQAENTNQTNPHVWAFIAGTDKLYIRMGKTGDGIEFIATNTFDLTNYTGLLINYDGYDLDATSLTNAGLTPADRFEIQTVDLSTGVVSDVAGTWTVTGNGVDASIVGDFHVGSMYSNGHVYKGQIASCVVTTQLVGATVQDAEKAEMVRDPMGWLNQYKVGEDWRTPGGSPGLTTNFQIDHTATDGTAGAHGTKVWLMGDGTNDAFPLIASQVNNTRGTQKLSATGMTAADVVNVTIPGLS